MSRRSWRSDNRGFPSWHKGRLVNDDITDEWAGTRSGKLTKQRGLNILQRNYDNVTNDQFKGLGHIAPTPEPKTVRA